MSVAEQLDALGGVATSATLTRLAGRAALAGAVAAGEVVRVGRGRYRTVDADRALRRAVELRGMASHLSAAQLHGWEIPQQPAVPWVSVPRNREVPRPRRAEVVWADLGEETGFVTSPRRTVIDCARRLPFATALAVADSALRVGDVDARLLVRDAGAVRGKGAAGARRVAAAASAAAANPFESVLRALALDVGLDVVAQGEVSVDGAVVHPDLVDRGRRLAIEADSHEWHASKEAFRRDCWRYTALAVDGWTVLRFTWWQVMGDPDWVIGCLRAVRDRAATGANAA